MSKLKGKSKSLGITEKDVLRIINKRFDEIEKKKLRERKEKVEALAFLSKIVLSYVFLAFAIPFFWFAFSFVSENFNNYLLKVFDSFLPLAYVYFLYFFLSQIISNIKGSAI